MEKFINTSYETLHECKIAELVSFTGHFENCFDQSFFVVNVHCGKDDVVFYFNRYQLALDFYLKYSKRPHSYKFMLNRLQSYHNCNYVYKLLQDDSINKLRFENPNKQKVIEFYASCTCGVVSYNLSSNGEFSYTIKPVQKS